jgi:hypothetical protein
MSAPKHLVEDYKAALRTKTVAALEHEIRILESAVDPRSLQLIPIVQEIIRERKRGHSRRVARGSPEVGFGFMTRSQKAAYNAKMAAHRLNRERAATKRATGHKARSTRRQ